MKIALWILAGLLLLGVLFGFLQYIAAERVEVVVLHTIDDAGKDQKTHLWVVDYAGHAYLRAGQEQAGWYARLMAHPLVEIERNGVLRRYTATQQPDDVAAINRLMQEKYTWGNTLIGLMIGGRDDSTAIKLEPLEAP